VDIALVKNTPIHGRVSSQFSANMFNIFNRLNLGAAPINRTGVISSTVSASHGAPYIGPGEPFAVQWALKILF
jgi:hypothetical protein